MSSMIVIQAFASWLQLATMDHELEMVWVLPYVAELSSLRNCCHVMRSFARIECARRTATRALNILYFTAVLRILAPRFEQAWAECKQACVKFPHVSVCFGDDIVLTTALSRTGFFDSTTKHSNLRIGHTHCVVDAVHTLLSSIIVDRAYIRTQPEFSRIHIWIALTLRLYCITHDFSVEL